MLDDLKSIVTEKPLICGVFVVVGVVVGVFVAKPIKKMLRIK
jgi:hypothetical protein